LHPTIPLALPRTPSLHAALPICSDRVIGSDGGDDLGDGTPHRAGERIALLGPIDDEGPDPTGDGEVETLVIDRTVGTVSGHMLCLPYRTQPRLSGTSRWS